MSIWEQLHNNLSLEQALIWWYGIISYFIDYEFVFLWYSLACSLEFLWFLGWSRVRSISFIPVKPITVPISCIGISIVETYIFSLWPYLILYYLFMIMIIITSSKNVIPSYYYHKYIVVIDLQWTLILFLFPKLE